MKKLISFYLLLPFLFLCNVSSAQVWRQMLESGNSNFYQIQKQFYKENKPERENFFTSLFRKKEKKEAEVEKPGYEIFKRWEYYTQSRVFPSGDITLPMQTQKLFQDYLQAEKNKGRAKSGSSCNPNWRYYGPNVNVHSEGVGRVNFVRFMPGNNQSVFIGTPDGGLWKSTDGGVTWKNLTDFLQSIGCADLVIDPTDTNKLYLATGDGDAGDSYTIGVYKSINGGATWVASGLTFSVNSNKHIYKLLINSNQPNILLAATSNGIYRTTNSGANWKITLNSAGIKDMKFKPLQFDTIFACNTNLYISVDTGKTFSIISNGTPTASNINRMAIGVTPANPNYVYLLTSDVNNSGWEGLYRSTDGANSFSLRSNQSSASINIMGWNPNGTDLNTGQGWYTLSIAVSNTNSDSIWCGGVNVWGSGDGGVNWNLNAHWYGGNGAPYVHADIHDLVAMPNSSGTIWVGCDGGVYNTTTNGVSWNTKSSNLPIGEIYGMGLSAHDTAVVIGGWQDNGTNLKTDTGWIKAIGGDGMLCFIDKWNDNNMFAEYYNGAFQYSMDGGQNFNDISITTSESKGWVTPWMQDPNAPNILYAGLENIWKSTDRGTTWNRISNSANMGTNTFRVINVAPSNSNYIYAGKSSALWLTTDGGNTWTNISAGLPVNTNDITDIEINPNNPNIAWVTFSGYSNNTKIYATNNGGNNWTNISTGLPNLPCNTVAFKNNSNGKLYVGMDVGVYERDSITNAWQLINIGLPNVSISDLHVDELAQQIRVATYGRGIWVRDLIAKPIANFTATIPTNKCTPLVVQLNNKTTNSPFTSSWDLTGVNPATSNVSNPVVIYNSAGKFNVTLIASNICGSDTFKIDSLVKIDAPHISPTAQAAINDTIQCLSGNNFVMNATTNAANYQWTFGDGNNASNLNTAHSYTNLGNYKVIFSATNAANCTTSIVQQVHVQQIFIGAITGTANVSSGQALFYSVNTQPFVNYVWNVTGGTIISGQGTDSVKIQWNNVGVGSVSITAECGDTISKIVSIASGINEVSNPLNILIEPNITTENFNIIFQNNQHHWFLNLYDEAGKLLQNADGYWLQREMKLNGNYAKGIYFLHLQNENNESAVYKVVKI